MAPVNKGEIFYLHEQSKNLTEIADITEYPEDWIGNVIEGIKGTDFWDEAIKLYKEYKSDREEQRKHNSTSRDNDGRKADKVLRVQHTKSTLSGAGVSKSRTVSRTKRPDMRPSKTRNHPVRGSIVDELRKSVDYKGEL